MMLEMRKSFWVANVCFNPVSDHPIFVKGSKLVQEQFTHRKEKCLEQLIKVNRLEWISGWVSIDEQDISTSCIYLSV